MSDTIWPIKHHTQAKHELLRRYLGAWFPIFASGGRNRQLVYLDGFAGPGVYQTGEPGSPLIALDTLVKHPHFETWTNTEFFLVFIEAKQERFDSLQRELDGFWEARDMNKPDNIRIQLIHDKFAEVVNELVTKLREHDHRLAPTFAFVDPFGWSGVPMKTIRDLLAFNKCEVLFNFMYDSVNRFVTDDRPGIARSFQEMFGTDDDEHRLASNYTGDKRKEFLRNLYAEQLQAVGGFEYVRSFELMDDKRGRTAYYLMFGTRHRKGLEVMKDAMWKLDPETGVRFRGLTGDEQVLFGPELNTLPLKRALLKNFAGESVNVKAIEQFVIEGTDYRKAHYKKVLKSLEESGQIICESKRKRRGTYPAGTILRFDSGGQPGQALS